MKCSFCSAETNMTVRNSEGQLFNCCKKCKTEKHLNISVIWKDGRKEVREDGEIMAINFG